MECVLLSMFLVADAYMGKQLHSFSILIAIVLGIEFVFGMIVNLFVSIPSVLLHPQGLTLSISLIIAALAWSITSGKLFLILHSTLGILLLGLSVFYLGVAHRAKAVGAILIGWLGLLAILFAALNGVLFLLAQQAINSIWMAAGFGVAIMLYAIGSFV